MSSYLRAYGALELKRSYQRNLCLGVIISAAIHVIATLGLVSFVCTHDDRDGGRIIAVRTIAQLVSPPPPPGLSESSSGMETFCEGSSRPVSTNGATEKLSKGRYYGEVYGTVYDTSAVGAAAGSDSSGYVQISVPSKQSLCRIVLVETDRMPECVSAVLPSYPESAREDGIEGEVWLQVLVNEGGNVGEVRVFRKSGTNVGFEQRAMDAALKWKYRPALCNRRPVAVWILYTLRFRLRSENVGQTSCQGERLPPVCSSVSVQREVRPIIRRQRMDEPEPCLGITQLAAVVVYTSS